MKLRTEATFRDDFSKLTTRGLVLEEDISPSEMSVFHAFSFPQFIIHAPAFCDERYLVGK
jgi:hypothetical protein